MTAQRPLTRASLRRAGFTLLEIFLTVSMSVVLMGLIGGAIQFYARNMDVSSMDIRQTQLAAAIIQMIEDDLRATIHNDPVDMSGLAELLGTVAAQGGGDTAESDQDLTSAGIMADEEDFFAEDTMEAPDLTSGVAMLQSPGLIGNQFQIQIDVSRLPRLEEYLMMLDEEVADIQDIPSDVKTVTYYVQPAGAIGVQDKLTSATDPTAVSTGGLVRRSLDRAATNYAASLGSLSALTQTGEVLAPEVLGIEFSYWDGITWQLEWSSDEYEELPLAVQIQITMGNPTASSAGLSPDDENATRIFTHIVRLPMAQPIEEDTETGELTEAGL
jgi:hypothetical protein